MRVAQWHAFGAVALIWGPVACFYPARLGLAPARGLGWSRIWSGVTPSLCPQLVVDWGSGWPWPPSGMASAHARLGWGWPLHVVWGGQGSGVALRRLFAPSWWWIERLACSVLVPHLGAQPDVPTPCSAQALVCPPSWSLLRNG